MTNNIVKTIHTETVSALARRYRSLPWYKKMFFPRSVAMAIYVLPASTSDYTVEHISQVLHGFLNSNSIFKRFFNCLNQFRDTPLMQAVLPHYSDRFIPTAILENTLTYKRIFKQAIETGNVAIFEQIPNEPLSIFQNLVEEDNYAAFCLAATKGHLGVLQYLKEKMPGKFQIMIEANNYEAFRNAAANGHLEVLNYLAAQAPDKLRFMIEANNYEAFRNTAANGYLDVLSYLAAQAPDKLHEMIRADNDPAVLLRLAAAGPDSLEVLLANIDDEDSDNYSAFHKAAANGHLKVLEYLATQASDRLQAMIASYNYHAFRNAAQNGHLKVLKYLAEKAPDELRVMIAVSNYEAFRNAAQNGYLDVLKYLAEKAPDELQAMIKAGDYEAFCKAAANGHLEVLKYLAEKAPDELQAMIQACNYKAFREAAANGHLEVLKYLAAKAPDKLRAMIQTDNYVAFRLAAAYGHLEVLKYLAAQAPDKLQAMIQADYESYVNGHYDHDNHYVAFRLAAAYGHLEVLKYLAAQAPNKLKAMIQARSYDAFREAAEKGHLEVLKYLAEKAPDKLQAMIRTNNYGAFRNAAANGHLEVLKYLAAQAPAKLQWMIAANNYEAFRRAAANGHLEVLKYLVAQAPGKLQAMITKSDYDGRGGLFRETAENNHLEVLKYLAVQAPEKLQAMIETDGCSIFSRTAEKRHSLMVNYLLSFPKVFAYAEMHVREYSHLVNPFVQETLTKLREQKSAAEAANPVVFDVTDGNQAKQLFYVLRNLIRRNDVAFRDDILFLIRIPAVKTLAHQAVTPSQPNELLRLALSLNNRMAVECLLTIPAVRELAERNSYYRAEARGGLDLRALAQNRESSMTALTEGERRRMSSARERYQPVIDAAGVSHLMTDLRERLEARYAAHPARITVKRGGVNVAITLPMKWAEFRALSLSASERKLAEKAYYQHKDHTTWRYLSRPNFWMHEHASYVYISDDRRERWSTFEEYQSLIVLLYLAAIDSTVAPIDGYTLETRIEQFITELALIGRAHNWDRVREKRDSAGNIVRGANGRPIYEEYDDLEGDKPSCYSGVLRRLFQAVQGHPLLKILSRDLLDEEIRSFVYDYFKETLAGLDSTVRDTIRTAWTKFVALEDVTADEIAAISQLDISEAKRTAFVDVLKAKWGGQFDAVCVTQVEKAFQLAADEHHLTKFDYINPGPLLGEEPVSAVPTASGIIAASRGLFGTSGGRGAGAGAGSSVTPVDRPRPPG